MMTFSDEERGLYEIPGSSFASASIWLAVYDYLQDQYVVAFYGMVSRHKAWSAKYCFGKSIVWAK